MKNSIITLCSSMLFMSTSLHGKLLFKCAAMYGAYKIGQSAGTYAIYSEYDKAKDEFLQHKKERQQLEHAIQALKLETLSKQELKTLLMTHPELSFVIERILKKMQEIALQRVINDSSTTH